MEEGDAFIERLQCLDRLIRLKLTRKECLSLGEFPAQKAIELDPLHTPQGMGLIAGILDQDRKAQGLQFLLCGGVVEDHGVFHHEVTALGQQRLIIRGAVFADVGNTLPIHSLPQFGNAPGGGVRGSKAHRVQGVHLQKQIRHGGACQIDILRRDGNARQLFQPLRDRSTHRLEHESLIPRSKQSRAARVVVHGEVFGVPEFHAAGRFLR